RRARRGVQARGRRERLPRCSPRPSFGLSRGHGRTERRRDRLYRHPRRSEAMSHPATGLLASAHLKGPHVDFAALSPLLALLGGATIVLLVGLAPSRALRLHGVPALSLVALGASVGLSIWRWHSNESIVSGALRIDDLSLLLNLALAAGGACAVLLAWRSRAAHETSHGEFHALLLTSVGGMSLLAAAQNTVALFVGIELLS